MEQNDYELLGGGQFQLLLLGVFLCISIFTDPLLLLVFEQSLRIKKK